MNRTLIYKITENDIPNTIQSFLQERGYSSQVIKELKKMIEEMRAEGRTVLVSTHMIDSIDMLWDRTLIMRGGSLVGDVTREALATGGKTLEELFFSLTEGDAQ